MRYAPAARIRYAHPATRAFARPPRIAVLSFGPNLKARSASQERALGCAQTHAISHPGTWKRGYDRTERLDLCAPGLTAPVAHV